MKRPNPPSLTLNPPKKRKIGTDSPFPTFTLPTATEALNVHTLLTKAHPGQQPSSSSPSTILGNVPNVIESLIGVILSQNTAALNSSAAKSSLDAAFGRNNFPAIASAPQEHITTAIRQGGLANKKAATIQKILVEVMQKHGAYSLQHLAELSDEEAMSELMAYDGVGPKTASCVLLFCLGRHSFPVDTHVFRLSKVLGWVPDKADRVSVQAHLDRRIPAELKYGLHTLMVQHGRSCKGCKKTGSSKETSCVLKTYVRERRLQAA